MDGLYASMTVQTPYLDDASTALVLGDQVQDQVRRGPERLRGLRLPVVDSFAAGQKRPGPNLTVDSWVKTMEDGSRATSSAAPISFTPTKRLGSDASRLSQIVDGRWKVISEYTDAPVTRRPARPPQLTM